MRPSVAGSLVVLLSINLVFLYKYGSRATDYAAGLCLLYACWCGGVVRYNQYLARWRAAPWAWVAMGWISLVTLAVHVAVLLEALNVDRWSVIDSFLTTLYRGEYPYAARSHMGNPPGPMPVYFMLAAPFHLIGWLEALGAVGYGMAAWWLSRRGAWGRVLLLLMLSSPFLYWELAARSNVFTFSLLVLLALQAFVRKQSLWRAVAAGLALSTRSVFVLAYLVYYLFILRKPHGKPIRFLSLAALSALAFGMSFVPLVAGWPEQFWVLNPFIVQGSFLLPPTWIGSFFVVALVLTFLWKYRRPSLVAGIWLFAVIALYAIYHLAELGWEGAYLESKVDISYFIFCVPFLGYYVATNLVPASPSDDLTSKSTAATRQRTA